VVFGTVSDVPKAATYFYSEKNSERRVGFRFAETHHLSFPNSVCSGLKRRAASNIYFFNNQKLNKKWRIAIHKEKISISERRVRPTHHLTNTHEPLIYRFSGK
jgi:hypothetical protein